MATTTVKEYYPHAGLIWARVQALAQQFLTTVGMTLIHEVSTDSGYHVVKVFLTLGSDTTAYWMYDLDHDDTEYYGFDYFWTLPGMRQCPPVLPKERGTFQVKQLWESFVAPLREYFVNSLTNATVSYLTAPEYIVSSPPAIVKQMIWRVRKGLHVGVDQISVTTADDGAPAGFVGSQPDNQGQPAQAPCLVVGSGGGSIDTAPIVAALNDIALIDVDYVANNGGAVFSLRGKVKT